MGAVKLSTVLKRELKGENLTRLAMKLGISISLLHDWYWGCSIPSGKNLDKVLKLSEFLGLSLESLLFDRDSRMKSVMLTTFYNNGKTFRLRIEEVTLGEANICS